MSPDIRQVVLDAIDALGRHAFDWDHAEGLPLRPDVATFTAEVLADPTLIALWGDEEPDITLDIGGTLHFDWGFDRDAYWLTLWVPCRGVIVITRTSGTSEVIETIRGETVAAIRPAIAVVFAWFMDLASPEDDDTDAYADEAP